jgi:hypothetical protein
VKKTELLKANLDAKYRHLAPHRVYETTTEWVGFMMVARGCWRFVALDNDLTDIVPIGRVYTTRKELMADMGRYISESGY